MSFCFTWCVSVVPVVFAFAGWDLISHPAFFCSFLERVFYCVNLLLRALIKVLSKLLKLTANYLTRFFQRYNLTTINCGKIFLRISSEWHTDDFLIQRLK